jgi:hypothetical protein
MSEILSFNLGLNRARLWEPNRTPGGRADPDTFSLPFGTLGAPARLTSGGDVTPGRNARAGPTVSGLYHSSSCRLPRRGADGKWLLAKASNSKLFHRPRPQYEGNKKLRERGGTRSELSTQ